MGTPQALLSWTMLTVLSESGPFNDLGLIVLPELLAR